MIHHLLSLSLLRLSSTHTCSVSTTRHIRPYKPRPAISAWPVIHAAEYYSLLYKQALVPAVLQKLASERPRFVRTPLDTRQRDINIGRYSSGFFNTVISQPVIFFNFFLLQVACVVKKRLKRVGVEGYLTWPAGPSGWAGYYFRRVRPHGRKDLCERPTYTYIF